MSNHERSPEKNTSRETWKDKLMGNKILVAAAVTGVLAAASVGGLIIANNANKNPSTEINQSQSTSSEKTPAEIAAEKQLEELANDEKVYNALKKTHEERVTEFSIPAEAEKEQLNTLFLKQVTAWANDGANDGLRYLINKSDDAPSDTVKKIARENANAHAEALFGENWKDSPEIVAYVEDKITLNASVLDAFRSTAWSQSDADAEPYKLWVTPGSRGIETRGTAGAYDIYYLYKDNSDRNSIPDGSIPTSGYVSLKSKSSNGKTVFTSISGFDQ